MAFHSAFPVDSCAVYMHRRRKDSSYRRTKIKENKRAVRKRHVRHQQLDLFVRVKRLSLAQSKSLSSVTSPQNLIVNVYFCYVHNILKRILCRFSAPDGFHLFISLVCTSTAVSCLRKVKNKTIIFTSKFLQRKKRRRTERSHLQNFHDFCHICLYLLFKWHRVSPAVNKMCVYKPFRSFQST